MLILRNKKVLNKIFNYRCFTNVNTQYFDGSDKQFEYVKGQLQRFILTKKKMDEERYFHHEKKEAKYDKDTGKIVLIDTNKPKTKKIIKNFDDLQKEKEKLHKELNLTPEEAEKADMDELAARYHKLYHITQEGYEIDKSDFYAESKDHMRIDWGLIIQRPPIFMFLPKIDRDFLVFKNKIMNEYDLDMRQYYEDFKEEASLVESLYANNSYVSTSNRDNLPTHELKEADGTVKRYWAASKNWKKVDPRVDDPHSLHNAPQQRVYLLLKNENSLEWEFPTKSVMGTESFGRVRQSIFATLSMDKWLIKHPFRTPNLATLRPFTEAEKTDRKNYILSGVRTFYFDAFHLRGLPVFDFDNSEYVDYAWVPKTEMNEFLTKERFDVFQRYFTHR